MNESFFGFINEKAGRSLTLWHEMGGTEGVLIACSSTFRSLEEGLPHIEKVREAIKGYIPGSLEIYVQEKDGQDFISLGDYAIKLKHQIEGWNDPPPKPIGSQRKRASS